MAVGTEACQAVIDSLTRFGRALREAGAAVSPAELLDAAHGARLAGITNRAHFRAALRASLAKSPEAQASFDQLFDAWFSVPWPREAPGRKKRGRRQRPASEGPRGSAGQGPAMRPPPEPRPGPKPAPAPGPEQRLGRAACQAARREAEQAQQAARARARASEQRRRQSAPQRQPLRTPRREAELRPLEREVERLGRALLTRYGRRYRVAARGRPDLRASIALAARTGGVPLRLLRRQRRILKPRLLVLCDVSGSVRRTAGFLLRLLHTTQRLFDQTAAFVFVDRPVSAAPLLRAGDATRGLAELETLAGLDLYALSDFGNLFVELLADHATLLTPRTSLLVLGDARCNRFDPQVWALEGIARRVAHLVWLNPERRERWYTADSRLRDYQPWIDHLLPAETPADLAAGVEALLRAPRPFERRGIG